MINSINNIFHGAAGHLRVTCTLNEIVNGAVEDDPNNIETKDAISNGNGIGCITRHIVTWLWGCLEVRRLLSSIVAADFRRRGRWRVAPSTITPLVAAAIAAIKTIYTTRTLLNAAGNHRNHLNTTAAAIGHTTAQL